MVSAVEELRSEWFEGVEQVGVTGATSTPRWLMEAVAQEAERLSLKDGRDETKRN
jgi:4-hydroxy-3-methylbut-2-enyl diphosphate reductase